MQHADIEVAILRLVKACSMLSAAVREVDARQKGEPKGLLSIDPATTLASVQHEIEAILDLIDQADS